MMGPGSVDAADADICGDFYDHIEDLLDFPSEEEMVGMGIGGGVGIGGDVGNGFLDECWPSVPNDLMNFSDSGFSGISCSTTMTATTNNTATTSTSQNTEDDLAPELSVSREDIAQLEWLSNFVEDSFSAGSIHLDNDFNNKDQQFRTSSPVSVLESSSCSGKSMPLGPDTVVPGRARSKRPRPATFSPRPVPIVSPTTSSEGSNTNPLLVAASCPPEFKQFAEPPPTLKKVPKKKKLTPPLPPTGDEETSKGAPVRKCMHCEIQKTPQWRMGPMGPKTLCNACGVRYKSGRLYPEYRPAASPTFVASEHSNSHKKVLEMRIKTGQNAPAPVPEFVRKTSHLTADCN